MRHPYMMATVWYLKEKTGLKSCRILEIGSFVGNSVLTWDEGIREYFQKQGSMVVIDPMRSYIDPKDYEKGGRGEISKISEMDYLFRGDFAYRILMHNLQFCSCLGDVQHLRCESDKILQFFKGEIFDIIYIDGSHEYKHVKEDIKIAKTLAGQDGIICGDDLELQLSEVDKSFLRDNLDLDFIQDSKSKGYYHPGVTLAVGEEFEQVSCWGGYWAVQKSSDGWAPFSLDGAPLNRHIFLSLTEKKFESTFLL